MVSENRNAIVTGGASGIGEATARLLAERDYAVAVVDIDPQGMRVADEIESSGGRAIFTQADVASEQDVSRMIAQAASELGALDLLVNNAAVTLPKGFRETEADEWDRVLAVNLRSAYLGLKMAASHLIEAAPSSVVNVSSFHAAATIENFSAYAAAKSGLVGLTRSAALDLAPSGVRVNAICPGIIETAMWDLWLDEVEDREATIAEVEALQPLGRIGQPREVAGAIAFLGSEEAAYITGTTLFVDGGVTARLSHA